MPECYNLNSNLIHLVVTTCPVCYWPWAVWPWLSWLSVYEKQAPPAWVRIMSGACSGEWVLFLEFPDLVLIFFLLLKIHILGSPAYRPTLLFISKNIHTYMDTYPHGGRRKGKCHLLFLEKKVNIVERFAAFSRCGAFFRRSLKPLYNFNSILQSANMLGCDPLQNFLLNLHLWLLQGGGRNPSHMF